MLWMLNETVVALKASSSQAKGTKSTSFLTQCVRNEVDLVPLNCEDAKVYVKWMGRNIHLFPLKNCLSGPL